MLSGYLFEIVIFLNLFTVDCRDTEPMPIYANCMRKTFGQFVAHEAAKLGNLALMKYLHKQGAKLNSMDSHGETPILVAALNNNWEVVRFLHEKLTKPTKICAALLFRLLC